MSTDNNYAPIVMFVYNRPEHVKQVIDNLKKCDLAIDSDLYIYSDAAKTDNQIEKVNEVRKLCEQIKGFNSVTLIKQNNNLGLAKNIIEGVTSIINQYGKIIVLEDDLLVSQQFLLYMNKCLDNYTDDKTIWHISAWNYPIEASGLPEVFPIRVMNCWGWATWKDRWQHFEKNPEKLMYQFNKKMIYDFDMNDSGSFWSQIVANHQGKINTWAIFWYATIFINQGLCLNPKHSLVTNIGHDGSGTHQSTAQQTYTTALQESKIDLDNIIINQPLKENQLAFNRIVQFYQDLKPGLYKRLKFKIHKVFGTYR